MKTVKCATCGAVIEKHQLSHHYHEHIGNRKNHTKGNCECGARH